MAERNPVRWGRPSPECRRRGGRSPPGGPGRRLRRRGSAGRGRRAGVRPEALGPPGPGGRPPPAGPARLAAARRPRGPAAGAPGPGPRLETLVLPGRVAAYHPSALDELTAAGEVVWSGAGGLPGGDGWVVLAPASAAPLLLPPPGDISMTPLHEAVLAALDGAGGMFFRMLCDRAVTMLPEQERGTAGDGAVAAALWDLVWSGRISNDTPPPRGTV